MKILLIGCGKMGGALLTGWSRGEIKQTAITILDPLAKAKKNIKVVKSFSKLPKNYQPDVVILAIKPQNFEEIAKELAVFEKSLFISIMAGKSINSIAKHLNRNAIVVRTMPNLPSIIGEGVIGIYSANKLNSACKNTVVKLLSPCGMPVWLKNEDLVDSITAISGSGPAYVFLFAKALSDAAMQLGLDEKTANAISIQTLKGSALLAQTSKESLEQLKVNVTSKGGTTEAGLKILEDGNILQSLVFKASLNALKRAKELAK